MKTVIIQYVVGDLVAVVDIDGLHFGTVMHAQWTSTGGTYYTVEYTQQNEDGNSVPVYWEFSEEEIDKAMAVARR